MENDGVWLSKARPPKSLKKTPVTSIQKGPLSRSTPPRRMIMSNSLKIQTASYLTQNSPPPTQLRTARKQSTLKDYFENKEDKVKDRVSVLEEREQLITTVQSFHCEQPPQMAVEQNKEGCVFEERSFNHNAHQDFIKSAFSEHYRALKEKNFTYCENGHLDETLPNEALIEAYSAEQSSGNSSTVTCRGCNKENIRQDCQVVSLSHLKQDARAETVISCKELHFEHQHFQTLRDEIRPNTISEIEEFTFSEGLKFLSQKDSIECDGCESVFTEQTCSPGLEHDDDLLPCQWEYLNKNKPNRLTTENKCLDRSFKENKCLDRSFKENTCLDRSFKENTCLDRSFKEMSSKFDAVGPSYLHAEATGSVDLKDGVQTSGRDILLHKVLDKHASLSVGHTDMDGVWLLQDSERGSDGVRMLQDSGRGSDAVRMLQDSERGRGSDAVRMLQDSERGRDGVRMLQDSETGRGSDAVRMLQDSERGRGSDGVRMLQDSERDRDGVRMLQDSERGRDGVRLLQHSDRDGVRMLHDSERGSDGVRMLQHSDRDGVRMLHDSDRDGVEMLHDSRTDQGSIDFTVSSLSDDRLAGSVTDCADIGVSQGVGTPDFMEQSSSVCQLSGPYSASVYPQWIVRRSDELKRKKRQYLSEIGTITFSEDM